MLEGLLKGRLQGGRGGSGGRDAVRKRAVERSVVRRRGWVHRDAVRKVLLKELLQGGARGAGCRGVLDSKSGAQVLWQLACQQPRLESGAWDRVAIMVEYLGTRGGRCTM